MSKVRWAAFLAVSLLLITASAASAQDANQGNIPPVAPAGPPPFSGPPPSSIGVPTPPASQFQSPAPPPPTPPPPPVQFAYNPVAYVPPVPRAPPSPEIKSYAGRFGFEVGLLVNPNGGNGQSPLPAVSNAIGMRAWTSDTVVLQPRLRFGVSNPDVGDEGHTSWEFEPSMSIGWAIYKGTSTRLVLAPGLRFGFAKEWVRIASQANGPTMAYDKKFTVTTIGLPASFTLEQRLTDRFAFIIGAATDVIAVEAQAVKDSDATWSITAGIDTSRLAAALVFYTD